MRAAGHLLGCAMERDSQTTAHPRPTTSRPGLRAAPTLGRSRPSPGVPLLYSEQGFRERVHDGSQGSARQGQTRDAWGNLAVAENGHSAYDWIKETCG